MNIRLTITTIAIYATLAMVIFFTIKWSSVAPTKAAVYPREIIINSYINFSDSTIGAATHLWDFGNGEKSNRPKGNYKFRKAGVYTVRLSINNQLKDTFLIVVKKSDYAHPKDSTVTIYANATGITGQQLHFKALGEGIQWCEWSFGESHKTDAKELEAFHSYDNPGSFEVQLITNLNPTTPAVYTVKIARSYKGVETSKAITAGATGGGGGATGNGNDLKQGIQAIAAGGNGFLANYKNTVQRFLCGKEHVTVIVNGGGRTDFYSYCQTLRLSPGTAIEAVNVQTDAQTKCPNMLTITQH